MSVMNRIEHVIWNDNWGDLPFTYTQRKTTNASTSSANWFQPNYSECRIYVISFGIFNLTDGNLLTIHIPRCTCMNFRQIRYLNVILTTHMKRCTAYIHNKMMKYGNVSSCRKYLLRSVDRSPIRFIRCDSILSLAWARIAYILCTAHILHQPFTSYVKCNILTHKHELVINISYVRFICFAEMVCCVLRFKGKQSCNSGTERKRDAQNNIQTSL